MKKMDLTQIKLTLSQEDYTNLWNLMCDGTLEWKDLPSRLRPDFLKLDRARMKPHLDSMEKRGVTGAFD